MAKEIRLSGGKVALVDDADYELVVARGPWRMSSAGYAQSNAKNGKKGEVILMHRLILGFLPGMHTDHRNRNKLDNRRANLRPATPQGNAANAKKPNPSKATSQFKGVTLDGPTWRAKIKVNGKTIHLGRWALERDAALAYDRAARYYFRDYASPNWTDW
jgi:hypothetical protein